MSQRASELSFTPDNFFGTDTSVSPSSTSGVPAGPGAKTYLALLETAELRELLERHNSLRDMNWQVPARSWPGAATDLTHPLFTKDLPPIELNKLYYPESGVMRWGWVYLLFTGEQIEAIKASPTGTLTLKLDDGSSDTLKFASWSLLASIPLWETGTNASGRISAIGDDGQSLHLALFCDERFWTANYSAGADLPDVPGSWNELLAGLLAACGIDGVEVPQVSPDYGVPSRYSDWLEIFQYNAASMLDAALFNAGLLLVRGIDGKYKCLELAKADKLEADCTHDGHYLRAGGDWSRNGRATQYLGSLPASVTVYFPVWDEAGSAPSGGFGKPGAAWFLQWNNDEGLYHVRSPLNATFYYPLTVELADAFQTAAKTAPKTANQGNKVFRESARALGEDPANVADLAQLAKRLAADYYLRKLHGLRQETWNGLLAPSGSGWFTYIYCYGLNCCTKIVGNPANHEHEQLMHDVAPESSESPSSRSSESPSSASSESPSSVFSESPSSVSSKSPASVSSESPGSKSSESPGSESVPSVSSESPSHSRPSESPESTSKSTAIVPASWSPGGYTKLFIGEMPEVRFDDLQLLTLRRQRNCELAIDPKYVEVCERDTIRACGYTANIAAAIGFEVRCGRLRILFPWYRRLVWFLLKRDVEVTVRLSGIRRGFRGLRFPDATRAEFLANERFLRMSQPQTRKR